MSCVFQVVITDVDECLEALHENVSANLPSHCTLAPQCLAQSQTAASAAKPPLLQPPVDTHPACLATADPNNLHKHSQPASDSQQHTDNTHNTHNTTEQHRERQPSSMQATEVLVAELDWGRDAGALSLPFDVVLIADVVSIMILASHASV